MIDFVGFGDIAPPDYCTALRLNEQQKAAATASPVGVRIVRAGAGCGKTMMLIAAIGEAHRQTSGRSLLLVLNKSVQEELTRKAAVHLPSVPLEIKTFHAYALRLVMHPTNASLLGFKTKPILESRKWLVVKNFKQAYDKDYAYNIKRGFSKIHTLEVIARSTRRRPSSLMTMDTKTAKFFADCKISEAVVDEVAELMVQYRWANNMVCFHDLPYLAARLPQEIFGLQPFEHLFVDEGQDLNKDQHDLVRKLTAANNSLLIVGDACQAIYCFAGAKPELFSRMSEEYDQVQEFGLSTNYRSEPAILDFVNKVSYYNVERGRIQLRDVLELQPHREQVQKVNTHWLIGLPSLYKWISNMVGGGQYTIGDMAFLYRYNRFSVRIEQFLAHHHIPYRFQPGCTSFVFQGAIRDTLAWINFVTGKGTREDWKRIVKQHEWLGEQVFEESWALLNTIVVERGKTNPLIHAVPPASIRTSSMRVSWNALVLVITSLLKLAEEATVSDLARVVGLTLAEHWGRLYDDDPEAEEEANELFTGLIEDFGTRSLSSLQNLVVQLEQAMIEDEGQPAVTLSTVHKAKGLEWDVVVLWEASAFGGSMRSDSTEEACIEYVAASRARDQLAIAWSGSDPRDRDIQKKGQPTSVFDLIRLQESN